MFESGFVNRHGEEFRRAAPTCGFSQAWFLLLAPQAAAIKSVLVFKGGGRGGLDTILCPENPVQ